MLYHSKVKHLCVIFHCEAEPVIGFSATLWHSTQSTHPRLEDVLYNYENSYSQDTGKFTCPQDGIYLFSATAVTTSGSSVKLQIRVGSHPITTVVADGTHGYHKEPTSGSNTVMSSCRKGEHVSLVGIGGKHFYLVGHGKTTFSALLVGNE